jgi:Concanavalin A-like lectin/glucanases superfamily/Polysaccharide lyase
VQFWRNLIARLKYQASKQFDHFEARNLNNENEKIKEKEMFNLRRYVTCSVLLVIAIAMVLLYTSNGFCLNPPDARYDTYIDMGFESPAYIYEYDGYDYLREDGFDFGLAPEGSGYDPVIISNAYEGTKNIRFAVGGNSSGVARSEMLFVWNQVQDTSTTYYSSFAMFVANDAPIPPGGTVFWQIAGGGWAPPLNFNMNEFGDYTLIKIHEGELGCRLMRDYLNHGAYNRFFIEYELASDEEGHVRVWKNGVKKLDYEGQTTFDTAPPPSGGGWGKYGIYRRHDPSGYTSYFDNVRWGTNKSQVWYGSETTETQVPGSLIGQWKFDEMPSVGSTIVRDSSPGCSYVGDFRNGATQTTGEIGGAVSLDGTNDYVSVPDSILWDTDGEITVSCRFKTSTNQTGKGLVMHDVSNYKYMLYLSSNSAALAFYVRTASGVTAVTDYGDTTGYFADGDWHHVVGVYDRYASDGKRVKLYVDGSLAASATGYNEDILAGDEGIHIGRWNAGYFAGQIDDVNIYNYAFSAKEVESSELNEVIGHWRFDDDGDKVADDSSGNNNRSMLLNGPTWTDGHTGRALSFDGTDDYVRSYQDKIWDTGSEVSVSCWFKTSENQSSKSLVTHDESSYKYMLYMSSASASLSFCVRTESGVSGATDSGDTVGHFADGEWHHMVGVYDRYAGDGKRLKLYVDGTLEAWDTGYNEDIDTNIESIWIGRWAGGNYFDGVIDDVAIYRFALTGTDVEDIYDGPLCDYDFDENGSIVACDSSFADNAKGILKNGADWDTGHTGSAVSFDGSNDYVAIPDSSIWDTDDEITVSCRFKTSTNQSGKGLVTHDCSNYKHMLYLSGNSGDAYFLARTASGVQYAVAENADGYYADGEWHHIVGVYDRYASDGKRIKLYLDDTLVDSATCYDEPILAGDEGIHIGRWNAGYFAGAIDDVVLFKDALNDTEISGL